MEYILLIVLILMLLAFGYAQSQRHVFRLPGDFNFQEEEELETR